MPLPPEEYHRWYDDGRVWETTTYMGVPILKWLGDLWNYQEILYRLRPSLIVEFGSWMGGSALYFADTLTRIRSDAKVLSVDIDLSRLHAQAWEYPAIEFMQADTVDPNVAAKIQSLRGTLPGAAFFIVDSDHHKAHVLGELELLRDVTQPLDYVVVEDGHINGHPIRPNWGEGPYEALTEYFRQHPEDYHRDHKQESKFGFTFAPGGYLIRR